MSRQNRKKPGDGIGTIALIRHSMNLLLSEQEEARRRDWNQITSVGTQKKRVGQNRKKPGDGIGTLHVAATDDSEYSQNRKKPGDGIGTIFVGRIALLIFGQNRKKPGDGIGT